jgi:hypothetical protein
MKDFCNDTGYFRFDALSPMLKRRGWALLNFALWWKHYIGSPKSHRMVEPLVSQTEPAKRQAVPAA